MKPKKPKRCKHCDREFAPYSSVQKACSPKCQKALEDAKAKRKKAVEREKKKVSIKALTLKADLVFGKYIRQRDERCATCGSTETPQCGHFVSRKYKATRWDETNANRQCSACNLWGSGRQWEHGKYIDAKYGEGTADALFRKANDPGFRLTADFLQERIEYFTEKLKDLEKS